MYGAAALAATFLSIDAGAFSAQEVRLWGYYPI